MAVLPTGIGSAVAGGYNIERSLRFNSADTTYLNRTPGSAGNRKTWTWSGWIKRGDTANNSGSGASTELTIFGSGTNVNAGNGVCSLGITGGVNFQVWQYLAGAVWNIVTTQVFRDYSAWYHILIAVDTTQATSSNRVKMYVNGVQVTAFGTASYPSQNYDTGINSTDAHNIGRRPDGQNYWGGYLTENYLIDGQALTPSSFGQTNTSTGVWEPIPYTGTYGTNGFYLNFSDNSGTTSTTLGKDYSGNGNNWTPNNFSVTAGAGNDSLVDSPTSYGTDTGVGGEVRGNYATLNPLTLYTTQMALADGNLQGTGTAGASNWGSVFSTINLPTSGKWYVECIVSVFNGSGNTGGVGVIDTALFTPSNTAVVFDQTAGEGFDGLALNLFTDVLSVRADGVQTTSVSGLSATSYTLMLAVDIGAGKVWGGYNGTWVNSGNPSAGTGEIATRVFVPTDNFVFHTSEGGGTNTSRVQANFGQRPFAYTAPSGFKALCTQNLPTPTIGATSTTQANDYFNPVLYTGTGSTRTVTGVGFQPDFLWIKERSEARDHALFDAVRGAGKYLFSNTTDAEDTATSMMSAFTSDGFTVGASSYTNANTQTYVSWNWKAGGTGVTNTAGTITSTVSANTTAGFSVVTWTYNSSGGTIGHGLGVAPSMIIQKIRDTAGYNWDVYHVSVGATKRLSINTTAAEQTFTGPWNNTTPTSTVFSSGASWYPSGDKVVSYCFAAVPGYSAFGSYTGNGSTDGPFVFTNFRPRFVMIKISSSTGNWVIIDTARGTYNAIGPRLYADLSDAEYTADRYDILSNGFKIRTTSGESNSSGGTYIYMALAENPFKYSLGR